jgi:DnaJ-class molecular chaperone
MHANLNSKLPCRTCNDAGVIDEDEPIECAACDGTGKTMGTLCICCDGSGEQQVMAKAICPDCMGGM